MAERITVTIETGTSAFGDEPASELARILFEVATRMQDGDLDTIPVIDRNGIIVGSVKVQRLRK